MNKTRLRILKRMQKVATPGLLGGLGLVMLAFGQAATAQPARILITEVLVDAPSVDQLTINGMNFDNGGSVEVTLGEVAGTLNVLPDWTATQIVADLPVDLPAGDYLLTVSTGNANRQQDVYDLTIGDVGPTQPI